MQTSALISLFACSVVALTFAVALPMMDIRFDDKPRYPLICIIAAAVIVAIFSGVKLATGVHDTSAYSMFCSLGITVALVSGVFAMWIVDLVQGRLIRHEEESLVVALLVAAILGNLLPRVFCSRLQVSTVLLWCVDGVLVQAACASVIGRWRRANFRRYGGDDPPDLGVNGCHRDLWEKFPRPVKGRELIFDHGPHAGTPINPKQP